MALTLKQVQDICLMGTGASQCRFLAEDEQVGGKFYCLKLVAQQKPEIDQEVAEFIKKHKDRGVDPYSMGLPLADNCFAGEVRFITYNGLKKFKDVVNKSVRVLGQGGFWKDATVKSFGNQKLLSLNIERDKVKKSILVTENHRWFVKHTTKSPLVECFTTELKAGDRLASVYGRIEGQVRPSAFGIAQGIVFGDGTREENKSGAAHIVLCGNKNEQLLKYFPLSPNHKTPNGIKVVDLPRNWKKLPSLNECKSFLYGWLSGYFAADGSYGESGFYLHSAKYENLEFAKNVAIRLGIGTHDIKKFARIGLGTELTNLYSLPFISDTTRPDFFLIDVHANKFKSKNRRSPHRWVVSSIDETSIEEEVFCAVVPEGHAFALDGNILTGNCGGYLFLKSKDQGYDIDGKIP